MHFMWLCPCEYKMSMGLKFLQIEDFRIIKKTKIVPTDKINIITGGNAAGKSSLLEAIDILSRGRSFRTNVNSHLINSDASSYKIHAKVDLLQNTTHSIGVEWSTGRKHLRLDGNPVYKQSVIAKLFPVRSMNPQGNNIVSGTPKQKRSHIDWGVFHVKPDFNDTLQIYQRILDQKNLALKRYTASLPLVAWDTSLSKLAQQIDLDRGAYVDKLNAYLGKMGTSFEGPENLKLEYRRGWSEDSDFIELLKTRASRFAAIGHVDVGPHLADYEILAGGKPAKIYASGGQQKLISATFIMAQVKMLQDNCGKQVTFLVDDLPSELDQKNRNTFLKKLCSWNVQVFITLHDQDSLPKDLLQDHKLFHVKQGVVQEL